MSDWFKVATLLLRDHQVPDNEGLVIVSTNGKSAALTLSLREDGDVELTLGEGELERVIDALQRARDFIQQR